MDVLLINASYQVLSRINWQRAVALVCSGDAQIVEQDDSVAIHSPSVAIPMPKIVRLVEYRYVPDARLNPACTFKGVRQRDRYTCCYCGEYGNTIDHIFPKSRGGKNTWENLACSCTTCNNRKGDRTPVEAGMKLLWVPRPPKDVDQDRVWAALEAA